jgi:hypothetical protein
LVLNPVRGRSTRDQLQGLSAPAKLMLARFLHFVSKPAEALAAYRHFLEAHPQDSNFVAAALEAGRFAAAQKVPDEARWFLEQALLVIATLLVPLNFLVMPSVLGEAVEWFWLEPLIAGVALTVYTGLLSLTARADPAGPLALAGGGARAGHRSDSGWESPGWRRSTKR